MTITGFYSDSVSTINPVSYPKINYVMAEEYREDSMHEIKLYVANQDSNTISVFDGNTHIKIKDIEVGDTPFKLGKDEFKNKLYVTNSDSGTVSVINTTSDKVIKKIQMGKYIDTLYLWENNLYVLGDDHKIYVMDTLADELVAGTIFNIQPENAGVIRCQDYMVSPLNEYIYIHSNTGCNAYPNKGFEFHSWVENLGDNSTRLLNISNPISPWEFLLNVFNVNSRQPETTLDITRFGNFTAIFKEQPAPIPSEYWIPLYVIVASTIVGWSIPSIIGYARSKKDVGKLNYYHKKLKLLYSDGTLDEKDINALDELRVKIIDAYSKGKINEKHYGRLNNEISMLYEEIFKKRIESLSGSLKNPSSKEQLKKLKDDLENAYSKQKITEQHYNLLNKKISDIEPRDNPK